MGLERHHARYGQAGSAVHPKLRLPIVTTLTPATITVHLAPILKLVAPDFGRAGIRQLGTRRDVSVAVAPRLGTWGVVLIALSACIVLHPLHHSQTLAWHFFRLSLTPCPGPAGDAGHHKPCILAVGVLERPMSLLSVPVNFRFRGIRGLRRRRLLARALLHLALGHGADRGRRFLAMREHGKKQKNNQFQHNFPLLKYFRKADWCIFP